MLIWVVAISKLPWQFSQEEIPSHILHSDKYNGDEGKCVPDKFQIFFIIRLLIHSRWLGDLISEWSLIIKNQKPWIGLGTLTLASLTSRFWYKFVSQYRTEFLEVFVLQYRIGFSFIEENELSYSTELIALK